VAAGLKKLPLQKSAATSVSRVMGMNLLSKELQIASLPCSKGSPKMVQMETSAASRPVAILTKPFKGARRVGSKTCHRSPMNTSKTAWKSVGLSKCE
jgi:hypothetical protein